MILFGNKNMTTETLVTYGNGLLYNWYAVNGDSGSGSKVFAPSGWHVPTQAEFNTLETYLGGANVAGGKMKSTRTSAPYFQAINVGATDESGFRGFGAGVRYYDDGSFGVRYIRGEFWSSTVLNSTNSYVMQLIYNTTALLVGNFNKKYGLSVRLIKDDSNWYPGMVVTDLEGNKYATVKIGNQVWLKSNWKCTKYNDGTAIPNVTNGTTWAGLTTGAYCSYNNQPIIEYTELF